VRGNPKQIGGRSLRGKTPNLPIASFPRLWQEPVPTATVRAISRSRPASLSRGSGSQYYRRPGFEAQPLTMKRCAALFHRGGRRVSAAPFLT
jgi:hypothetical protein